MCRTAAVMLEMLHGHNNKNDVSAEKHSSYKTSALLSPGFHGKNVLLHIMLPHSSFKAKTKSSISEQSPAACHLYGATRLLKLSGNVII